MLFKLTARLLVAVSNSTKREIVKIYSKNPNFPTEEAEVDSLMGVFDSVMPSGIPEGKKKIYALYLAKQLFGLSHPSWVVGDAQSHTKVKGTLVAFELAQKEKRLTGQKADINQYETLQDVMNASAVEKEQKRKTQLTLENLPETTPDGETPKSDVENGSQVIASDGAWKVYKIKKGDPAGKQAGSWLGHNKWWGVEWCIGRDRNSWESRRYMDAGDFYFFAENGISRYAMATDGRTADIYNPGDTVVWNTDWAEGEIKLPSLEKAAQRLGVSFDMGSLSSLPHELIPVLSKAVQVDPYLSSLVPQNQLVQTDVDTVDAIINATPALDLVQDLESYSRSEGTKGVVRSILSRCTSRTNKQGLKDFTGVWSEMSESLLVLYIEALGVNKWTSLPPSLEEYLIKAAEEFSF